MTDSWRLFLLLPLHISWPRLGTGHHLEPKRSVSFQPEAHAQPGTNIDPARCVLKCSFVSQTVSQLLFFLLSVFYCETAHGYPRGTDWCLPCGPAAFIFLSSPQAAGHGVFSQRKGYVGGLEGTVLRCVNTQPAMVWPEDRLNQYCEATSGRDYVECLFSRVLWSCDGPEKCISTSTFVSNSVKLVVWVQKFKIDFKSSFCLVPI